MISWKQLPLALQQYLTRNAISIWDLCNLGNGFAKGDKNPIYHYSSFKRSVRLVLYFNFLYSTIGMMKMLTLPLSHLNQVSRKVMRGLLKLCCNWPETLF